MNLLRPLLAVTAGACFSLVGGPALGQSGTPAAGTTPAPAAASTPAYTFPRQFNADELITTANGNTVMTKMYMDTDKIRSEITREGMAFVTIVRLDQKKIYTVMDQQKMVMAMPLDQSRVNQMLPPGSGGDAQVVQVGTDTVDGTAAMKYQITSGNGKVLFLWVGAVSQFPIKMTPQDGSFTVEWKNFKAGPQDPSLFEVPTGYQVMAMPTGGGMPGPGGGAPPAGGGQ